MRPVPIAWRSAVLNESVSAAGGVLSVVVRAVIVLLVCVVAHFARG